MNVVPTLCGPRPAIGLLGILLLSQAEHSNETKCSLGPVTKHCDLAITLLLHLKDRVCHQPGRPLPCLHLD